MHSEARADHRERRARAAGYARQALAPATLAAYAADWADGTVNLPALRPPR
jgi:hypothetical protein